ncbi:hypothetical protein [Parvimonas micra]|uniref:hypothetical protein n=1 Tax=Parvimonas micra TaxID=33033 RepID=UPI00123BD0F5|nr:hypothetical protein [Parvimonas micra]
MTNNKDFKEIKIELEKLKEDNYRNYIKAILSIELNIEQEEILDYLYDKYMDNDNFNLLNDEFEIEEQVLDNNLNYEEEIEI